jgi:putative ABC transport system permease protein
MQSLYSESVWALRNVRARGWRAVLAASLLAVALAANLLIFSTADSLVFHRVPYHEPERLVSVARQDPAWGELGDSLLSPALLDEWRKQADVFSGVHGYLEKTLFLTGGGEPDLVRTADITPGLIELLGAAPRWGRSLDAADAREIDPQVVVISERLARRRFGNPAQAVGRHLETTDRPLLIVGVMARDFRFPEGRKDIWRVLDPRGPLTRGIGGVQSIARLAPTASVEAAASVMAQRSLDIATAAGHRLPYTAAPGRLPFAGVSEERRTAFLVLLGASFLLLLITAANVVSLELASAFDRARVTAVQLALGASNASLQRTALIEGLCIVILGFAGAVALSSAGLEAVVAALPERFTAYGANPIDLDRRAIAFTAAIAVAVWFASWMPALFRTISSDYMTLLKTQGHTVTMVKSGARVRAALTVAQVALAVVLLVGGVLYVRSYAQLVRLEKGFDSTGLAEVSMTLPPQVFPSAAEKAALTRDVINRIKSVPGVIAASAGSAPPSMGDTPSSSPLEIDERAPIDGIRIWRLWVDADYFSVLRMPLKAGRYFEVGDPLTNIIVSETFARRFWKDGNAIGGRFRVGARSPWSTVVGMVGHVRTEPDGTAGPSTDTFQTYVLRPPPPPPRPNANAARIDNSGGSYPNIGVMVRLDSASRAGPVLQAVRAVDSRFRLRLDFVDDTYTRQFDDRLMATQIIGVFGALAFAVAMAGIYGVMAFLVAQRTRELGIRVALGADRPAIRRLVLGGSLRLATIGILFGIVASVAASRWVQSQLFGVSAIDPATFSIVAAVVLAAAVLATWQPLRHASRVDPVVALRSE